MFRMAVLTVSQLAVIAFGVTGLVAPLPPETAARADPPEARPRSATGHARRAEWSRDEDGLFRVTALVNGTAIRFVVDTGANIVVLSPADARRAGVVTGGRPLGLTSSAGSAIVRPTILREVRIGSHVAKRVDAVVADRSSNVSLLGQSALSRLGTLTLDGTRMHLS